MTLAWITGAAGFIGRHLVRHVAAEGAQVAGFDLIEAASAGLDDLASGWCTGAVSPGALAALAAQTGKPDVIYHLAGGSSVGASLADPHSDFCATLGTCAMLLEWIRVQSPQSKLVIVSSAAVYGNGYHGPIPEEAITEPFSSYGAHKCAMEETCRGWANSFGLGIVVARLFSVYGPGLTKQLLWDLSCKLSTGTSSVVLGGTGEELRDWTHVDDVVRALTVLAPLASSEMPVINVGTGSGGSVRAIAERLTRAFDRDPSCLLFSGISRTGDPFSLVAAPGRLQASGFEWRVNLEAGISDYARWYRARSGA